MLQSIRDSKCMIKRLMWLETGKIWLLLRCSNVGRSRKLDGKVGNKAIKCFNICTTVFMAYNYCQWKVNII